MKNLFAPTSKNNYRAYLMKTPVLLVFVLIISFFNFLVKVDTQAQGLDNAITVESLLKGHNIERNKIGAGDLRIDSKLSSSAQAKAELMFESNCWSHYCPEGRSPWTFFDEAQYDYVVAGENLAEGYYDIEDVMSAWMNSQTHRDNILNKDYEEVGFGIISGTYQGVQGNLLIVAHFGSEIDDLIDNNNAEVNIVAPANETIFDNENIKVEGTINGSNQVNIFLNGVENGAASINNGLFTYNLKLIKKGDNYIYAQAPMTFGMTKDSNVIKVIYNQVQPVVHGAASATTPISEDFSNVSTSPEIKNMVNLGFVVALALLFLIDFIVLSRSKMLGSERSFSHYHFGIFFILAIIVLVGGFGGGLKDAISI